MPAPSYLSKESRELLERAREITKVMFKRKKFKSDTFRAALCVAAKEVTNHNPYEWQLDVAEAAFLGLDTVISAGTGFGKTLPFVLVHLIVPDRLTIIVSPLNALEYDQVKRFEAMGLKACAVNAETFRQQELRQKLAKGYYQIAITSPEMLLGNDRFIKYLRDAGKRIDKFVIDEAHCINQWQTFRNAYSELGDLRAVTRVPVMAASATLPPSILQTVLNTLLYNKENTFFINLGNDRPNLHISVRLKKGSTTDPIPDFLDVIAEAKTGTMKRRFIFVDACADAQLLTNRIRSEIPPSMQQKIAPYSSLRGLDSKQVTLQQFMDGKILVLVTTEAAAMGLDAPDIEEVIQYGAPPSICTLVQRIGRAGRTPSMAARAIVIFERGAFQIQKIPKNKSLSTQAGALELFEAGKSESMTIKTEVLELDDSEYLEKDSDLNLMQRPDPGVGLQWKRRLDTDVREFARCSGCRRIWLRNYFNSPLPDTEILPHKCCDICAQPYSQIREEASSPSQTPISSTKIRKMDSHQILAPALASLSSQTLSLAAPQMDERTYDSESSLTKAPQQTIHDDVLATTELDEYDDDASATYIPAAPRRQPKNNSYKLRPIKHRPPLEAFLNKFFDELWIKRYAKHGVARENLPGEKIMSILTIRRYLSLHGLEDLWPFCKPFAAELFDGMARVDQEERHNNTSAGTGGQAIERIEGDTQGHLVDYYPRTLPKPVQFSSPVSHRPAAWPRSATTLPRTLLVQPQTPNRPSSSSLFSTPYTLSTAFTRAISHADATFKPLALPLAPSVQQPRKPNFSPIKGSPVVPYVVSPTLERAFRYPPATSSLAVSTVQASAVTIQRPSKRFRIEDAQNFMMPERPSTPHRLTQVSLSGSPSRDRTGSHAEAAASTLPPIQPLRFESDAPMQDPPDHFHGDPFGSSPPKASRDRDHHSHLDLTLLPQK
ncbi:P-loop containing nucleoside triphosphate hydrolase protein [Clavulina sp. PMI_390]|nr:P-loop containing nucleoside triphosphate hydrolase protein [Clavulina sp. PMI_390]